MERYADSIRTKLAEKLSAVGKGDLFLADFEKLDGRTARVLIAFEIEGTTRDDVENFVIRAFDGKIRPEMATLKFHPADKAASIVVKTFLPTRPIDDSKKMAKLTPDTYVDAMKQVWAVEERNGAPYLIRQEDEDIDTLLAKRRAQMLVRGSNGRRFATITNGILHIDVGDVAKYYHSGDERVGEVVSINKGELKIKRPQGFHMVEPIAVIAVLQKSAELDVATKKKLVDYFTQAYGDAEYAKKLVHGS